MIKKTIICDACGKEITDNSYERIERIRFPLMNTSTQTLIMSEIDLCKDCLKKISACYYNICEEHHSSGVLVV